MTKPHGPSLHGLFVGLTTLDCIYQADHPPAENEKVVAQKSLLVAGGPATNAAVAFNQFGGKFGTQAADGQAADGQTADGKGNQATLLSVIGEHSLTSVITEDLQGQGVRLVDLMPTRLAPPPVSSIVVTQATGDRTVITRNAQHMQAQATDISPDILTGIDVVLIDGHQMAVSAQIAQWAKAKDIPIVIDAGSWKPNFETVLALADVVVASANFYPPGCDTPSAVLDYLKTLNITKRAITRGSKPILYCEGNQPGEQASEVEVPQIRAVDTLAAGDIFHGSFCHFHLGHTFTEALLKASRSASFACQYWGTRDWTKIYRMADTDSEEAACKESEN
ncbi:MAG: PfkB family carbohydrate kinase [Cyanobacteria bacterium J06597_16]